MSELSRLFKSSVIVFGGQVLGRLSKLAGQILAARLLVPAAFGEIALAYTIIFLVSRLYSEGIGAGITRKLSVAESKDQKATIAYTGISVTLGIGIICLSAIIGFRQEILGIFGQQNITSLALVFSPILILYPLSNLFKSIFQSHGITIPFVLSHHIVPGIGSLAVLLLVSQVYTPYLGAITYWFALISLQTMTYVILAVTIFNPEKVPTPQINVVVLSDLWRFSWPLIISSSIVVLLSNMDILMIGYFLSSNEVGLYKAILPFRGATLFILSAFTYPLFPLLSQYYEREQTSDLADVYKASTKWITIGTIPIVTTIGMFSNDIIKVFLTSSYQEASLVLSVLVFGMFFRAIAGPTGTLISAADMTRIEMYASISAAVANILLNILLIPTFGLVGAGLATVAGFIIYNILELYYVSIIIEAAPISTNIFRPTVFVFLSTFFLSIVCDILEIHIELLHLFAIGTLISIITLLSLPLTNSISENDKILFTEIRSTED